MITIEFETESSAFGQIDSQILREIAHVLHMTASNLDKQAEIQHADGCTLTKMINPIKDINGNTIGTLTYTKDLFTNETTDAMG